MALVTATAIGCSPAGTRASPFDAGRADDARIGADAFPDGGVSADARVSGEVDLPPVPRLHFQVKPPRDADDYPFSPTVLPAYGPAPRTAVYLSSEGSQDPEGMPVSVFWNVRDPSGEYLAIAPTPASALAQFVTTMTGRHVITLEVMEKSGLQQIGQATLELTVSPIPCAADGISPPCADALPLPGGSFTAGSPAGAGYDDEHPSHPTNIAPFSLDKYEVTVGRFRAFVSQFSGAAPAPGAGAHPFNADSGWRSEWNSSLPSSSEEFSFDLLECGGTWTDTPGDSEARPISCVTWFQALAFCVWDGKRLPTEAEWEYAAAAGDQQRTYPWGDDPPSPDLAAFACAFDGRPGSCSDADLPVVGSAPAGAGRWGHVDLAGSVWEWTLDAYGPYSAQSCDNCANVADVSPTATDTGSDNTPRVFRGGDYRFDDPASLRAASRYAFDGSYPDQTRGFRCARSLTGS